MSVTYIGFILAILGTGLFVFGSITSLFLFVLFLTLFGGAGALYLGDSSVMPAHFAMAFLLLRMFLPGGVSWSAMVESLRSNIWFLAFTIYAIFSAMIMPHVFAGALDVTPMRGFGLARPGSLLARILYARPLEFTPQNITTCVYILGSFMLCFATFIIMRREGMATRLVKAAGILGIEHALIGYGSVIFKHTPLNVVFEFFRNANYSQADHEWGGFIRMNGIHPEASVYAAFAIVWFVFNFECWLRDVQPRLTGIAALLLGFALLVSTSSSAYVGMAVYAAVLMVRVCITPGLIGAKQLTWLVFIALTATIVICTILVLSPMLVTALVEVINQMTVGKAGSFSGRQRLFWATQGVDSFFISYGLGVGPGSFRSSSLSTAILGSMGVIGVVTILGHFFRAFKPMAVSTWVPSRQRQYNVAQDVAGAAVWAILIDVAVASISSPSSDPGLNFALLSATALALRWQPRGERETETAVPPTTPVKDGYLLALA